MAVAEKSLNSFQHGLGSPVLHTFNLEIKNEAAQVARQGHGVWTPQFGGGVEESVPEASRLEPLHWGKVASNLTPPPLLSCPIHCW